MASMDAPRCAGWRLAAKDAADRSAALVLLLAVMPLLVAIIVALRFSSSEPVIFRQKRVGRGGQLFEILKFRTMTGAAPGAPVLERGLAPGGAEGADRRTRLGNWLRASSLDELPQLVNVLKGEMSLIGPRPERPEFAAAFAAELGDYAARHRMKAGMTGWAQANGSRGNTSIAERVALDNYYIDNWSFALELRTLALTAGELARFRDRPPAQAKQLEQPASAASAA